MMLQIKVIPKSSQNTIVGFENGVLKIKCTAVPEKGKANAAVIELLSQHYKVPKNSITIVKGHNQSRKVVKINILE